MELDRNCQGVVIAPAGHGKTHLIGTRIAKADPDERLLTLTHTNVAVRALRKHVISKPVARVRMETIDAVARRISTAFPASSGVPATTAADPGDSDWEALRTGAVHALDSPAIRAAFSASYTGLIVDEFQDCSRSQAELVRTLAHTIPTVVLGDPLQSIYGFDSTDTFDWAARTEGHPELGTLGTPWRWRGNPQLGQWILDSRKDLYGGMPVTIGSQTQASICILSKPATQGGLSTILKGMTGTVAVISGESAIPSRTPIIARSHRWNQCAVFEKAIPDELSALASAHSQESTREQAQALVKFAKACLSGVGDVSGMASCESNLKRKGNVGTSKSPIARALGEFMNQPTGGTGKAVLMVLATSSGTHAYRPQLIQLAKRSYDRLDQNDVKGFAASLAHVLEARKHVDERFTGPVVGTVLRLKGLEFDNVVIVDPGKFTSIEQVYVAISRPARRIVFAVESGEDLGPWLSRRM